MSWRIIFVSNEAKVSLREKNLLIKQSEEVRVPLEDVGVILFENERTVVTTSLLNACVEHKITVFICDGKHMPSGMLLPYQQHSRQRKVLESQLAWTEPFKKRVWQRIIKQKISNQKQVLERLTHEDRSDFDSLIASVNSGDTLNREATAAQKYFGALYGGASTRRAETKVNSAMNYGYAIIRGVVARMLAGYGFLSSMGVHHISELNNFNLADDLLEPYRPVVDFFVFSGAVLDDNDEIELSKEERARIIDILTKNINITGSVYSVMYSSELVAQSLRTASNEKDPALLVLPEVIFPEND